MIFADKNKIKYTIENLITDAIDIPSSSNIEIFVEKASPHNSQNDDKNPSYVTVTFVDDGAEIDCVILTSLFSKFVADSRDGLGLGLYLAKIVIARHGGQIWDENNENGRGATFRFSLPIS